MNSFVIRPRRLFFIGILSLLPALAMGSAGHSMDSSGSYYCEDIRDLQAYFPDLNLRAPDLYGNTLETRIIEHRALAKTHGYTSAMNIILPVNPTISPCHLLLRVPPTGIITLTEFGCGT